MKSQTGFIQIPILIAIIFGMIVVGGASYFGVHQYQNMREEKNTKGSPELSEVEKLRQEIDELKKQTDSQNPPASQATKKPSTVTELKIQNPQQYKNLVDENKTQLLEATKTLSNKKIIARVKPSVAYIETVSGSGSGIIISSDGYVLTNAHVVIGVTSATVKLNDGRSFTGSMVGRDENADLALLKIGATGLTAAFLGDSDLVEQGDPVFTFGYPLGIEGDVAFKDGTLSRRQNIDGTIYLEISAQILPGNSGGPLVNQAGEVIGVNTLALGVGKVSGVLIGETLKYALPINVAKGLIPELKNGRNVIVPKIISPNPLPLPSPSPTPIPQPPPPVFVLPPPAPLPPPPPKQITISNLQVDQHKALMTDKVEAWISWDSNDNFSNGEIKYSKSGDLSGSQSKSFILDHRVEIWNLDEDTTYYYQIIIGDTKSAISSFRTMRITPLPFEFNPNMRVATETDEMGRPFIALYISISEPFDKCILSIIDLNYTGEYTNNKYFINPGYSWNPNYWGALPGQEKRYTGVVPGHTYEWEFTCEKQGFNPSTKKGSFTAPNLTP